MATLLEFINYTVALDNSGATPIITITDDSSLPEGTVVTSYNVTIVQPDGIPVTTNLVSGGSIVTKSIELRLANDGTLQNGTYITNAVVIATGYENTIKNKLFRLQYTKPTISLLPKIDVFTPNIKAYDNTDYNPLGLTFVSVERSFIGVIDSVSGTQQTLTADTQLFDLGFDGSYYDAQYVVTLSSIFKNNTIDGLSIIDKLDAIITFDAFTPSTLSQLLTGLNTLKKEDKFGNRYTKAVAIYEQIVAQGSVGYTVGLQEYVIQLENMIAGYSLNRQHTNSVIPVYVFSNTASSSSAINLPNGTTSWGVPYNIMLDSILIVAPTGTTITIGTTPEGTELSDYQEIEAGGYFVATVNRPFAIGSTIYFGGVLIDTEITMFKK